MNRHRGDILVCFELIRQKDAETLAAFPMRPPVYICKLGISCLSLEDLIFSPKGNNYCILPNALYFSLNHLFTVDTICANHLYNVEVTE